MNALPTTKSATDNFALVKLSGSVTNIQNIDNFGLRLTSTPNLQEDKAENQAQNNILGDRHIHIDILVDKYKEISEQIERILKEIDESEALYSSLDNSNESLLIKEEIQRKNKARKGYLESIKQQASKLKSEINRFNANKE